MSRKASSEQGTREARSHVAILAGGKGTRFWPLGRASRPKQVLALDGDDPRPLVRAAYERVEPLCDRAGPWTVAPKPLVASLRRLLPASARARFVVEPAPRNTAAAVILAAHVVAHADPHATLAVVPADAHASPAASYCRSLRAALDRAATSGRIVTLGLVPTFPATGYGYLEMGALRASSRGGPIHAVQRFVEKPDVAAARRFLRARRFLWNLGTFVFRPEALLAAVDRSFAEGARAFAAVRRAGPTTRAIAAAYRTVPAVSIDYAVMEKQRDLEVVAASFQWDDLGSWDAVARHTEPDAAGNAMPAGSIALDSKDCFVRAADGTAVALLGVSDLVVVRTKDALLVARKGRGEDVRRLHDEWVARGRKDLVS